MPTSAARLRALVTSAAVILSLTGFAALPAAEDEPPATPAATATADPAAPEDPATPDPAATPDPSPTPDPTETPDPAPTPDPIGTPTPDPGAGSAPAPAAPTTPSRILYIAIPHPDDEFEASALYADRPDLYKVFVLMTRGESTYHCSPVGYALSLLDGATPIGRGPQGMHTASCEEARLESWVKYFTAMSRADSSLPGDFEPPITTPAFPTKGVSLAREPRLPDVPGGKAGTSFTDTTARVWTDRQGRGALVDFDLGDGDLTPAKVAWAMRTVLSSKQALGLNTALPDDGVVGAYSNPAEQGCFVYTHSDHAAVDDALRDTDFQLRMQAVATCGTDPGTTTTRNVPADELEAAYPADGSDGAFAASYAWLETPVISRTDQSSLFMGVQSFDVRHQHVPDERLGGSDRFGTSVLISRAGFPDRAPVVYVASGSNYPDALSAGAAAAHEGGPLLLTAPWGLPAVVADEIARLHPARAVVVGGASAVQPAVVDSLRALVPDVVRLSGFDRYDTARVVARYAFGAGSVPIAYVASGTSFPDALSATDAAGHQGGPVLLTPGGDVTGAYVAGALSGLSPARIAVVGGPNAVPSSLDRVLTGIAPVTRLAGMDRFGTNAAVTSFAFSAAPTALIASGLDFPDALTGAAWGGRAHLPLLLARGGCLTKPETDRLYDLGIGTTTLLGGRNVVGDDVARGSTC